MSLWSPKNGSNDYVDAQGRIEWMAAFMIVARCDERMDCKAFPGVAWVRKCNKVIVASVSSIEWDT